MEKAKDAPQRQQQRELQAFLQKRLLEVSSRFGSDSETARLYQERLEELAEECGSVPVKVLSA